MFVLNGVLPTSSPRSHSLTSCKMNNHLTKKHLTQKKMQQKSLIRSGKRQTEVSLTESLSSKKRLNLSSKNDSI